MDSQFHIGCSSWTSPAWSGRFYPAGLPDGERLAFYAGYFDSVEVDSTYYAPPRAFVVQSWARKTPETFRFSLKFPRDLLDPKKPSTSEDLASFVNTAQLLGQKLGPILLQFPPWFRPGRSPTDGFSAYLERTLTGLPEGPRYAVELRDRRWYEEATGEWLRELLTRHRMASCWSSLNYVDIPPWVTTDWLYVRFIGDHETVPAEKHGKLRVDKTDDLRMWTRRLAGVKVWDAWFLFNNHYAGYAPASANLLRRELGLEPIAFPEGRASGHNSKLDVD